MGCTNTSQGKDKGKRGFAWRLVVITPLRRSGMLSDAKDERRSLVQAVIHCLLDYCNALLARITHTQIKKLQSAQNTATHLVSGARRQDHIAPDLRSVYWLRCDEVSFSRLRSLHRNVSSLLHIRNYACRLRKFKDVIDCGRHRLDVLTCQECRRARRWWDSAASPSTGQQCGTVCQSTV